MTRQGVATVARQEFRLRIRAGRWKYLLLAWFVLLALFTVGLRLAVGGVDDLDDDGAIVYGGLVLLVLGLSLLVVPSLAAQSVNGDRERGTLAALQVTRLSAAEITIGKFTAAWGTAVLFLVLTVPLALFAATQGGLGLARLLVVTLVMAVLVGVVCAISLWLSAVLMRTTTSGVLAYLAVALLTIGTLIGFGLASVVTQEEYDITYESVECDSDAGYQQYQGPGSPVPEGCRSRQDTYQSSRARTDRTWFLLAPNPFVIVADAAPALPDPYAPGLSEREARARSQAANLDPLGGLGRTVRDLRREVIPLSEQIAMESGQNSGQFLSQGEPQERPTAAVWPYGLAFDVLLAALALLLTARRLRTPTRTLPRGQRVA